MENLRVFVILAMFCLIVNKSHAYGYGYKIWRESVEPVKEVAEEDDMGLFNVMEDETDAIDGAGGLVTVVTASDMDKKTTQTLKYFQYGTLTTPKPYSNNWGYDGTSNIKLGIHGNRGYGTGGYGNHPWVNIGQNSGNNAGMSSGYYIQKPTVNFPTPTVATPLPLSVETQATMSPVQLNQQLTAACIRACPVTYEYNPVCGTNDVTYSNIGRLECAQNCGVDVKLSRRTSCLVPPSPSDNNDIVTPPTSVSTLGNTPNSSSLGTTLSESTNTWTDQNPSNEGTNVSAGTSVVNAGNENNSDTNSYGGNKGSETNNINGTNNNTELPIPASSGRPTNPIGIASGGSNYEDNDQVIAIIDNPEDNEKYNFESVSSNPNVETINKNPIGTSTEIYVSHLNNGATGTSNSNAQNNLNIYENGNNYPESDNIEGNLNSNSEISAENLNNQEGSKLGLAGSRPNRVTSESTNANIGNSFCTPGKVPSLNEVMSCMQLCPLTSEYSPVCGTDGITYTNPGRLLCAQFCGMNVRVAKFAPCASTSDNNFGCPTIPTYTNPPVTGSPAPLTPPTPSIQACMEDCPVTSVYQPVCGTNNITYKNIERLECAKKCGIDVSVKKQSACGAPPSDRPVWPGTEAPTVPTSETSEPSQSIQNCIKRCTPSPERSPVCGTNNVTYTNIASLNCERLCGIKVHVQALAACPGYTPPPTPKPTYKPNEPLNFTISEEVLSNIFSEKPVTPVTPSEDDAVEFEIDKRKPFN